MTYSSKALALAALLALPIAVRAQQGGMQTMPGMTMPGHGTAGSATGGMGNMQAMMNQCARMRRGMAQGTMTNAPDMNRMMAQCDQMDRQMGDGTSSTAPMPSATRSR